jgi:uncharacterized membrane protein
MREWIEMASVGIEWLAVATIAGSVTFGSLRFLLHLSKQKEDPFRTYKILIGRSLLLGLEFLVAADVIRTVALELTPRNIGMLGGLVMIRTFLSWSLVVELGRDARRRAPSTQHSRQQIHAVNSDSCPDGEWVLASTGEHDLFQRSLEIRINIADSKGKETYS